MQSCWLYKDVTYSGLKDFAVEELSFSGVKVAFDIEVDNPNFYKISATDGEIAVKANEIDMGKFQLVDEVVLPKKSKGVVSAKVETSFKSILSGGIMSIMTMFRSGGQLVLNLNGYVNAKALGLKKRIAISSTEKVSL